MEFLLRPSFQPPLTYTQDILTVLSPTTTQTPLQGAWNLDQGWLDSAGHHACRFDGLPNLRSACRRDQAGSLSVHPQPRLARLHDVSARRPLLALPGDRGGHRGGAGGWAAGAGDLVGAQAHRVRRTGVSLLIAGYGYTQPSLIVGWEERRLEFRARLSLLCLFDLLDGLRGCRAGSPAAWPRPLNGRAHLFADV